MGNRKRILSNILSLSTIQAANYVLPIITVPYLVRVLGPGKYGLIAFAQAFVQYFGVVIEHGINLSAAREISIHRDNKEKIVEIFSSVIFIKIMFVILSFTTMCLMVFSITKFRSDWAIYCITFGSVVGSALFPTWFYQGIENMRQVALTYILAKLFFTIAVFIVVKSEADYLFIPMLNSLGSIVSGIISLLFVFMRHKVSIIIPSRKMMYHEFKEGWQVFLSTIATSINTGSSTFILGLFTENAVVGYYSAADKIIKAVAGCTLPLTQSVYPHISKLAAESKEAALIFIRKIFKFVSFSTLCISLLLLIFAPEICTVILGKQFSQSIPIVRILAFLPFVIGINNILGVQTMLNFGMKSAFMKSFVLGNVVNLFLSFALVVPMQHIGIAISALITELIITTSMFIYLYRQGLHIIPVRLAFWDVR